MGPDHRRGAQVVQVTCQQERGSETPQDRVRALVKEYQVEHGWEFLFIGANQDAALTAEKMGMDRDRSLDMSYSAEGAEAAQESISANISHARKTGETRAFEEEKWRRQRDAERS